MKRRSRVLPGPEAEGMFAHLPLCIRAEIANNQVINFLGEVAILHDLDGVWYYKLRRKNRLIKLTPHTFFEIGETS